MTNIMRTRVELGGWTGAPGVSTIYWTMGTLGSGSPSPSDVANTHQEIADMWQVFHGFCITGLTSSILPDVDVLDVASGDIIDVVTSDEGAINQTTGSGNTNTLSRATMAVVALRTSDFFDGRRLQGRWFIGPLCANAFDTDGTLSTDAVDDMTAACVALTSGVGPRLAVYSRPKGLGGTGRYGDVTAAIPRATPGVLRSRRD